MLLVGIVQAVSVIILSVNLAISIHRFSGFKSRSTHIFIAGMMFLGLWNLFHFLTNLFRNVIYFYFAIISGYSVIQALIFFSTALENENMLTLKSVIGLILLAVLLGYLGYSHYTLESFILLTGDYIVTIRDIEYRLMEIFYIGYGILVYTHLTLKITWRTKNTKHYKYALSLFMAALLFLIGGGGIVIINVFFLNNLFSEELVHLSYIFSFGIPLIYAIVITTVLICDPAILWVLLFRLHHLFVLNKGGVPIFSYTFQEKHKHVNALVASMISAIVTAISEVTETEKEVKQIVVEDRVILLTQRRNLMFALIADRSTQQIRDSLYYFADLFVAHYNKPMISKGNRQIFHKLLFKAFPFIPTRS